MDKKKKPTKIEEQPNPEEKRTESPTLVTEVVEVIEVTGNPDIASADESKSQPKPKAETSDIANRTEAEEEKQLAEEKVHEETLNDAENPVNEPEKAVENDENKPKQVVEELFSKKNSGDLMEISINRRRNSKKTLALWAIVVIVAALVIGSGLILFSKKSGSLKTATVKPTPETTMAPTPTVGQSPVDRSTVTVQVLNGGGKAGAATKMKTLLTGKGYQVKDVGNTDEYSYNETQILVKPDKAGALDLLQTDLKDSYTVGTAAATLSADSQYDAQVIVGKE